MLNLHIICLFAVLFIQSPLGKACILETKPLDVLQCITLNPQALVSLMISKDISNLCTMVDSYMKCFRRYLKECADTSMVVGGQVVIGAYDELMDLNSKCCISKDTSKCITKNPDLLKNCFGPENFVRLEDNSEKRIMDVKIGDIVKSVDSNGHLVNSEIVAILHKEPYELAEFYKFESSTGDHISLTGDHLINVIGKGFIKAANVKLNDKLRVYSNGTLVESVVVNIEKYMQQGYIAPLAESGTVLVNNVDASCYADIKSHSIANFAMKPLVAWHKLNRLFGIQIDNMNYGVNAYALALNRFSSNFLPFLFE